MWFKRTQSKRPGDSGSSNPTPRRGSIPSILSAGFKCEGDIVSDGEVHIIGSHTGNLVVHKLTLGEGGSIIGTVEAEAAVINVDNLAIAFLDAGEANSTRRRTVDGGTIGRIEIEA